MATHLPNPEGFDDFFIGHFHMVESAVAYVTGDRQVAEEIAQDAFIKLLQHWAKVSRYERPDLWVRRVALRDAQRERRRGWRRATVESNALSPAATPTDPRRAEVLDAVAELAPKQRAVVVLFYFEDRPMDEIASILDCSVSTGWSQLHNARKRLGVILKEEVASDVRR